MNQPVGGLQHFGRRRTFGTFANRTLSLISSPSVNRIGPSAFTRSSFVAIKFSCLVFHAPLVRIMWNFSYCGHLKDCWSGGYKKIFPHAISPNSVASSRSNVVTQGQEKAVINSFPGFLVSTNSAPTSPSWMSCSLSTGVNNLLFTWVHSFLK